MKKLLIVVGTRPNFIKITRFPKVLERYKDRLDFHIVHTGQHFDEKMSSIFFSQFGFQPDSFLNIPAGSANSQMAHIMLGLENTIAAYLPDLMLVVGDVNSTFAAALTANKSGIPIAHLESGLRSFDRNMPEEINRILTDEISSYFFITEESGEKHLLEEGKSKESMFFVGNTMIDTLVEFSSQVDQSDVLEKYKLKKDQFVLMTMHRPATVDHPEGLDKLFEIIRIICSEKKLVFPIHPRTLKKTKEYGMSEELKLDNLILTEPLDYFAFQKLVKNCSFVITDSGGIQEETTYYGIPCLTLRPNTERPSTVTMGTNELVSFEPAKVKIKIEEILSGRYKKGTVPPLWDGKTTERIAEIIDKILNK